MFRKAVLTAGLTVAFLAASLVAPLTQPAFADNPKIVLAPPGVPPIFISIIAFVAQDQGFFKKYGVDVELRQFDNGTAASRAVVSGDIDASMSATALLISQIANADVPLVGIYGFPKPDFELGTTNLAKATCDDVKGQEIGVDVIGGARAIALKAILAGGCHLTLDDVQQVALGSNTASALLAGQISYGILHLDDVAELQNRGKKVAIIKTVRESSPSSQNLTIVVRKDTLASKRDAFVRMMAGIIAAGRYMANPANADHVATIAAVTGRDHAISLSALKDYLKYGLWAIDNDGMDQAQTEAFIATQVKAGNIMDGKTPPTFDQMIDPSVWRDANAMVGK
jgi:NitT/TauT family transport system substrate-binding protein